MARTLRTPVNPVDSHQLHANEAAELRDNARSDLARASFDHAHAAHITAARLQARLPEIQNNAAQYRSLAVFWRNGHGRFRNVEQADRFAELASGLEAAAAAIPTHVDEWHERAMVHRQEAQGHEEAHPSHEEMVDAAAAMHAASLLSDPSPEPASAETEPSGDQDSSSRRRSGSKE